MSSFSSDFLIVGAGVIGMMLARELAQSGAKVALIERQLCAKESSWAGGGIVSPLYPWRYAPAVTRLATWSQTSYVHLSQDLLEETGIDPELRQRGMYMVDVEDSADALRWAQRFHRPLEQVGSNHLYMKEPNLSKNFTSALWMPEVGSIRNPRLGQALRASMLQDKNITLYENQAVTGLLVENHRVLGVNTAHGSIFAGHSVVAAGAWSAELLAPLGVTLPVEPVKGQMMVFKAKPGLLNRVVLVGGRYLIPRSDGRILVGSTLERVGFDKQATPDAYTSLYQTAINIMPMLAECEVELHWAGLRPGSPEGVPFIGAVPNYEGVSVNAGQFRNGLVLAPASTRLHADLLLGRDSVATHQDYCLEGRI